MVRSMHLIVAALVAAAQSTGYADWKYQKLELVSENNDRDVLSVSIDYEVKTVPGAGMPVPKQLATPVHINAWPTRPAQAAQAVFRSMVYNHYGLSRDAIMSGDYEFFLRHLFTEVVDLRIEGNHLFGTLPKPVLLFENGCPKCVDRGVQELALVIDGTWYKGFNGRDARMTMPVYDGID